MADTVDLPTSSRYKDTPVYAGTRGPEFALFEPPAEATRPDVGYRSHRVRQYEIGFLDKVAVTHYGDGTEDLWWFLALANGLLDPEVEMTVGMQLLIPPRALAMQFRVRRTALAS